jgi:hypothetical protein
MFDVFYKQYLAACGALAVAPLAQSELRALIEALVERVGATLQ